MTSSFDRPRTIETNASHSSLTYRKEASQVHSRYQAHPKHTTSFSSCVHPSSDYKPKPIARTVSSISHLNLQTGQLCRAEDTQQFQLPSQPASSSGTPLLSSLFLSTTTNSSSSPPPPSLPILSQPSPPSTWLDRRQYRQQHHYRRHHHLLPHHHQEQQPLFQQLQQQQAQHHTKDSMILTDQGRHVQEAITAFSRSMVDSKTSSKSPNVVPLLAISTPLASSSISLQASTPHSLSPVSGTPTTSPSLCDSLSSSSTATPYIASTSSTETATEDGNPLFLISQPIMPMSVIPAAIMGIKSTPSCVSVGGTAAVSSSLLPLVGCDYLSYSSLNATMASGIVGAESTPRPLSSMEYAESWLPAVTPATGSPIEPESAKVAVPRVSLDQESIHPFEMDPGHNGNSLSEAIQELPRHQQPPLHKKTSFAARLRKVFVKQGPSSSVETQEDIISLSSDDDNMADNHQAGPSLPIQHRGSVSSTSSSDTALGHGEIRRGSTQTVTPSTSPETSPLCSPTIASTSTLSSLGRQLGSVSSLSCPLPALDVDYTTESNDSDSQAVINDKRSLKALPSRAVKKKLSFASISSFFGSRNHQERHAKQQRSSSVPHVESPLTIVGRQIAGFQRRHSLNDPHDNNNNVKTKSSQSVHRLVTPPWDRDRVVLEGQSAAALTPGSAPIPAPTTSTKKMSLNSVFSKQLSKKKKKKNTNAPAPVPLPTKPLKSALVHRPPTSTPTRVHHVHSVSRRRSASIRSQNSARRRSYHHHHHQHNTSQHSSSSNDPFARLAEANQVLASLSRWNSEDQKTVRNQSKRDSPLDDQEPSFAEYDFCSSPSSLFEAAATFDGPQSPRRPPNKDSANTQFNSCTLSTPPTPRVLPITTRTTSPSGHSGSPYSPPFNPLSTLSRPSSCCSFASASEGIGSSSPVSERSTCSSSCSAYHGTVSCPQSGSRRLSNDQSFNPLLTASAARVSVDRIEMESQTNASVMTGGGYTPTLKSNSSTFSNSSTAVSRASSMNYKIRSTAPTAVYAEHQQQRGYRQLQLEQQQLMTQPASQQQHEQHHHEHFYDQDYQKYYYEDSSSLYPPSRRQLQFSMEEPIVYATWTPEQYDRTSDTNITAIRLTPAIALKIKMELNHFKSQEMEVHQDSQIYTHFFI